jgi:hypothetical protein
VSFDFGLSAFNVPPSYGFYHPPQEITFEDSGTAETSFSPSLIFNNDLGWSSRDRNGASGFLGGVADYEWFTALPLAQTGLGFAEGNCFSITNDWFEVFNQISTVDLLANPLKYRIDLRNYLDCVVSFDVRTYDGGWPEAGIAPGNGFEANQDYIKFFSHTSTDGDTFTKKQELYLTGGAGGGVEFIAEPLVPENAVKKALIPTEDIGTGWTELNYDDSGWLDVSKVDDFGNEVGGGIGYARNKPPGTDTFDAYICLDLEEQMKTSSTVYLRMPFVVEDKSRYIGLTLGARVDDGFVAYLNGHKVVTFKAPTVPLWNSMATTSNLDSIAITMVDHSLNCHMNKLVNGPNILAIQALNLGRGSDFLFSCQLEGITSETTPRKAAEVVSDNPNLKYNITGDAVTITGCDKKASGALIIPAAIEGKPVTSIGKGAFVSCTNLTSITIGDSVTSIGEWGFRHCSSLTSITIGDNVTSIG